MLFRSNVCCKSPEESNTFCLENETPTFNRHSQNLSKNFCKKSSVQKKNNAILSYSSCYMEDSKIRDNRQCKREKYDPLYDIEHLKAEREKLQKKTIELDAKKSILSDYDYLEA